MPDMPMSKYWAWTHNRPSAEAVRRLHDLLRDGRLSSACYSLECGSRLHLQGFLALSSKMAFRPLMALLGPKWTVAHVTQARDAQKAHDYALKDDETTIRTPEMFALKEGHVENWKDVKTDYMDVVPADWPLKHLRDEIGKWVPITGPGSRTDLKLFGMQVVTAASDGTPTKAYIDVCLGKPDVFLRYSRGSELLFKMARTRAEEGRPLVRATAPRVSIYYGPPGTGKSFAAVSGRTLGDTFIMRKNGPDGRPYWDGYTGQARIVIEEFAGWLPLPTLLGVTDKYHMMLDCRGTHVPLEATEIILTTNIWWESFYSSKQWVDAHKAAFKRRVHELRHYNDPLHPGVYTVLDMDVPPAFGGAGSHPLETDPHIFDDLTIPGTPKA